jgi:hypothetical protein
MDESALAARSRGRPNAKKEGDANFPGAPPGGESLGKKQHGLTGAFELTVAAIP